MVALMSQTMCVALKPRADRCRLEMAMVRWRGM
jgi:hypothetical protein